MVQMEECILCEEEISRLIPLLRNCFNNIPGNTWQKKLDHVNKCNCCARHQINKPQIFSNWIDTEFNSGRKLNDCPCNCRHKARFICRQFNNSLIRNNESLDILR